MYVRLLYRSTLLTLKILWRLIWKEGHLLNYEITMAKKDTIVVRIDEKLKEDASRALQELDISMSDAVRKFLRFIVRNKRMCKEIVADEAKHQLNE